MHRCCGNESLVLIDVSEGPFTPSESGSEKGKYQRNFSLSLPLLLGVNRLYPVEIFASLFCLKHNVKHVHAQKLRLFYTERKRER